MAKTTTNATSKKLDITAAAVAAADDDDDDIFYYIGVKASPFASDCTVFGLSSNEQAALRSHFPKSPDSTQVINGIIIKGPPFSVINALAELGYRVVCSTGEGEILWTLQREN